MIRLVLIDTKALKYSVFEGNKCLAEFIDENKVGLDAETIEKIRVEKYTKA